MASKYSYYKENESDQVWWLDNYDICGEFVFSFDKKKKYNLFHDYPDKLTVEEWFIFNDENPYWKVFFEDRNLEYCANHIDEISEYCHAKGRNIV